MDWIKAYALAKRNGGGGSGGLPEGATAYQQLVTDGDGNTKWEDRTHYKHTRIAIAVNPENDPWSDITSCYMGGTRSNDPVQVNQGKAIYTEVWENYSSGLGKNWVFYWLVLNTRHSKKDYLLSCHRVHRIGLLDITLPETT